MNKLWFSLLLAPFFAATLISAHSLYLFKSEYTGPTTQFTINEGEGFSRINYRLYKAKIINNTRLFHYYVKLKGAINKFKSGPYSIKTGMTMEQVLHTLLYSPPFTISITIPEGKNLYQIADILEKKKICNSKKFVQLAKDKAFLEQQGLLNEVSLEGRLYPDTYKFSPNTSEKKVLRTMLKLFRKKISSLDFSQSHLSKREILILASIVEKETGAKHERPMISGVFHNRLKKRMRLQSDPTTIYGIYQNFNGNLRRKHLQQKTPYNTYRINGLPKGPISNPGIDSIKATINPTQHRFLYFVSHNDGTHKFSRTYREHLDAVKKYQLDRRNRQGKSWRDLYKSKVRIPEKK